MQSLGGDWGEWWGDGLGVMGQGPGWFGWNCQGRALEGGTFELMPNRGRCRPLFECYSKGTKKPLSIGRGCTETHWKNGMRLRQYGCQETEEEREISFFRYSFFLYKMGLNYIHLLFFFSFQCFSQKMQFQFQRDSSSHSEQPAPHRCHSPGCSSVFSFFQSKG